MSKRPRRPRARAAGESGAPDEGRARRLLATGVFSASLLSRLLFWRATPDRDMAWTAYFQGDAPLWLDYARAIELGRPFELGLPIHPPGAAWLVALLWNGSPSGIPFLRFAWVVLGALVPLLVFLAAARSFPLRAAAVAGVLCAASTGLLVLSTSVNNETPYLVLVAGSLWFLEDLRGRAPTGRLAVWSALNAVACLFRVEHALFFALVLALFSVRWARAGAPWALRRAAASLFFFALPLVPWHASAWSAIARFNERPRPLTPVEERAVGGVEEATREVPWTPEAARMREELPGFARRTGAAFVLATAAHRGRTTIGVEEFRALDEAFGYVPRRLSRFPFVSAYGPLNFALANHADATGGFDRSPLSEPPGLAGGRTSYPAFLVQGLPPADLTFVYPPHLNLFNEGYAIGWGWIARHPADFVRLAFRKLAIFWEGAAAGFTGYNLPMGLSGNRRAVDLVTAEGGVATGVAFRRARRRARGGRGGLAPARPRPMAHFPREQGLRDGPLLRLRPARRDGRAGRGAPRGARGRAVGRSAARRSARTGRSSAGRPRSSCLPSGSRRRGSSRSPTFASTAPRSTRRPRLPRTTIGAAGSGWGQAGSLAL